MIEVMRRQHRVPVILGVVVLVLTVLLGPPLAIRNGAYQIYRLAVWEKVAWERRNLESIIQPQATVYYPSGDEQSGRLVGELFGQLAPQVDGDYGLVKNQPIQVVIYASRSGLASSMGWSSGDSALGVYWGGSIKLLSPVAWLGNQEPPELIDVTYRKTGPVAHEYTHYVIDQLTSGNIPRWLNEGLAQVEEQKLTGYQWLESGSHMTSENLYPLTSMDQGFDRLSNQALAYHQSYSLARYLVDKEGQEQVNQLLVKLGEGYTLDQAMKQVFGYGVRDYEAGWRTWLVTDYGVGDS